jgi:hypothetical protein
MPKSKNIITPDITTPENKEEHDNLNKKRN